MRIKLIKAPQQGFLRLLLANLRAQERLPVEGAKWGAVGLVQGSCPQHTQMLAIFGKQADVTAALAKFRAGRSKPGADR